MNLSVNALPPKRLIAGYALVSLVVIFYVPYFVPQRPSASDSYIFGYNNRVGVTLLLVLSTIGALWTKGLNLNLLQAGPSKNVSTRVLWVCLAITVGGCIAMYLFAGRFGGLAESSYEIDRAWLLSQGKSPYVDFEWPFGVTFLYGPLWLSHLLHLDIPQAYYLFWIASSAIGVVLLFVAVNLVSYPSPRKNSAFLLLYAGSLIPILSMGTHYTLVRYLCPLCCILLVHKVSIRMATPTAQLLTVLTALGFTVCLLLLSPEMSIAHAFACLVLVFPHRSAISPAPLWITSYLALIASLIALFVMAMRLHILDTIFASGGGADSFPIPASLPLLFFFFVVFLCICGIVRRWMSPNFQDNSVALIVISIPMLAAALGRCDPVHIFLNGIGFFMAASLFLSSSPRAWKFYRSAFIVSILIISTLSGAWFSYPGLGMVAMRTIAEDTLPAHSKGIIASLAEFAVNRMPPSPTKTRELERLKKISLLIAPPTIDFSTLYPQLNLSQSDVVFEAPFGYKPNSLGSYLSSQIDYGFYEGIENANTPAAVDRKISELASHPQRYLLIRDEAFSVCAIDAHAERRLISYLFVFPYTARIVHPKNVHAPLCDYISTHYQLVQPATLENYRYGLWRPIVQNP